jgi:hypothetical protein
MPDILVDYYRRYPQDYITFKGLTSDPPLTVGRVWFRSDLNQLRYSPDGVNIYVIDPAPVVDKSWSDITGHYFSVPPNAQYWNALPTIQLDNPASGHKRSYESTNTGYDYLHGWLLKRNAMLSSRLDITARIGAYHGYDNTRAYLAFAILDDNNLDKKAVNTAYPFLRLLWIMSGLGYANGSYGNPLSGYIVFTDPPSYSFSPANPGVWYNLVTSIPNRRMHIMYGYEDHWGENWSQWASLQKGVTNTNFRYRVATKPPTPDVMLDLTGDLPVDQAVIGKWDGEVRLWIKKGDRGFILPLGSNVEVTDKIKTYRSVSINMFEKIIRSGKEPERTCSYIELTLKTDRRERCSHGGVWRLILLSYMDELIDIVLGDRGWDGDKYGYYVNSFM